MKTINRWHTWTCFLSCPDLRQQLGATPALVVGRHQRQHWEDMTSLSVLSKEGSWSAWNLLRLFASAPSVSLEPGLPNNISHDWACHTRTGWTLLQLANCPTPVSGYTQFSSLATLDSPPGGHTWSWGRCRCDVGSLTNIRKVNWKIPRYWEIQPHFYKSPTKFLNRCLKIGHIIRKTLNQDLQESSN